MEENNGTATKLLGGVTGKGFLPGQSGNPSGRPKTLAQIVRDHTNNGRDLIAFLIQVVKGEVEEHCKIADRLKATDMLLDRGCFPKITPDEPADLPALNLGDLTEKELHAFEQFGLVLASIRQRATSGASEAKPE